MAQRYPRLTRQRHVKEGAPRRRRGWRDHVRLLVVIGSLGASAAPAQEMDNPPVTESAGVGEIKLANGLRALIVPSSDEDGVEVLTAILVGSADDPRSAPGLAHLLEHLAFRTRVEGREVVSVQSSLGASAGAVTRSGYTAFSTFLPSAKTNHLKALVELEAHRYRKLHVEAGTIEAEMSSASSEAVRPSTVDQLGRAIFGFDTGRGGPGSDVRRDVIEDHHARFYCPMNTFVVVRGRLDPDSVRAWVTLAFESWTNGPSCRAGAVQEPVQPIVAWEALPGRGESQTFIAFPAHSLAHPVHATENVAITYLADKARGSKGDSVRGQLYPAGRQSLAVLIGSTTVADLRRRIESALHEPIDAGTIRQKRDSLTSVQQMVPLPAERLVSCELAGAWQACFASSIWNRQVGVRQVREILRQWQSALDGGPPARLAEVSTVLEDSLRQLYAGMQLTSTLPRFKGSTPGRLQNGGAHITETDFGPNGTYVRVPWTDTLVHGAWLITLPPPAPGSSCGSMTCQELVTRSIVEVVDGRSNKSGVHVTARRVPIRAAGTFDAWLPLSAGADPPGLLGLQIAFSVPRAQLQAALDSIAELVWRGSRHRIAEVRKRQLALADELGFSAFELAAVWFQRTTNRLRTPGYPEAYAERRRLLRAIDARTISVLHSASLRFSRHRLVLIGPDLPTQVETPPGVREGSSFPETEEVPGDLPESGVRTRRWVASPDGAGGVWLGRWIPPAASAADLAAMEVAATILGSGPEGRLQRRLRLETGLALRVEVYAGRDPTGGGMRWFVHAHCTPENTERVLATVREELNKLRSTAPDEATHDRVVKALLGALGEEMAVPDRLASRLLYWRFDQLLSRSDELRRLTSRGIQAAAQRWLSPGDLVEVVVGDATPHDASGSSDS